MSQISEAEVLAFLNKIESGEVTLTSKHEPQAVYAGHVTYHASNGWQIVIFNDCNEWDYIDSILTNDGRELDFDEIVDSMPQVYGYEPTNTVAWSAYGIPGYLQHSEETWEGFQPSRR